MNSDTASLSSAQTHYGSLSSDDSSMLHTPYPDDHESHVGIRHGSSSLYPRKHSGSSSIRRHRRAPSVEVVQEEDEKPAYLATLAQPLASGRKGGAGDKQHRYGLGDFVFHRTLGTGSFGRVHLVRSKNNFRFYAIKVLNKEKVVKMKQVEHTRNERALLANVSHPFIVNLWGTFQDALNLYMVMDFVAGGELFSLLRKSSRFPDPVAKFYAAEVSLALHYLHSNHIIYRDLKPENILLSQDGHIKLTDFGFAKLVPGVTGTLCGTPDYLAPEIVEGRFYNKSVDWYALGVLIFEMLAGFPPFFTTDQQPNPFKLYELIVAGRVNYPTFFDEKAKDLIRRFLASDVTERYGNLKYGAKDIFAHPWFGEVPWERLYRKEIPAPYVPKIDGEGDASQFARYHENNTLEYGQPGDDKYAKEFLDFSYSA